MGYLESIILGVVEGLTEFLPVSSTGHLILASSLLGLSQSDFQKSFEIAIQLGAIAAVVVLFWKSFLNRSILARLAVAFVPTGIVGFVLYGFIKTYLLGSPQVVLWALLLGGVVLIVFELWHRERDDATASLGEVTYLQSLGIGFAQALAVVPGVSRSAASILGGLLLGLKRTTIVEFSFLLAVPTMLAATSYDLYKNAGSFSPEQFGVLAVGFVVSFVVALGAIRWLLSFVRAHTFISFGVYRVLVAIFFWLVVLR